MITDFFITCSGANKQILKECPTERIKFVGIGATIFLTALLASISGGYAIYFTFNSLAVSIAFGVLWGFIIFNLDRYIVSSIKKTGNILKEFLTALPRFLIAIVLGITISKPLEIKLFDGSITKKMGGTEDEYNKNGEADFNRRRNGLDSTKSALQAELETKKNGIYLNDPVYKDFQSQETEKEGNNREWAKQITDNSVLINQNSWLEDIVVNSQTGATRKVRRYNQLAMDKITENKKLNRDIADNKPMLKTIGDSLQSRQKDLTSQIKEVEKQYAAQIAGVQKQINELNARRPEILDKVKADAAADKDILSRLRALSELKSQKNGVWGVDLLLTLLFIFLECAPITVKLLAKRGPYDEILDRMEYEIFLAQQKIISDRNDEVNNELQSTRDANKLKREALEKLEKLKSDKELSTNESILNDIAEGQTNLGKAMVDKWYAEELSKVAK
jgi:hypothetical protein